MGLYPLWQVLGPGSQESSAAQKTKFSWMRFAQVTEVSRLLYVVIKMLKNRPKIGCVPSPSKAATFIKASYMWLDIKTAEKAPKTSGHEL